MYEIIFHILGLAILEIIFYFEYIGPMETKVFQNSINNAIASIINKPTYQEKQMIKERLENDIILKYIIGNYTRYEDGICNEYKNSLNQRQSYNNNLYSQCIKYWVISFSSFISLIIIVKGVTYFIKKNKLFCYKSKNNDETEIELTNINNIISYDDIDNRDDELQNMRINSSSTINIENIPKEPSSKRKILKYILYYILSFGAIITFEYFFFNNVILKYKITSNIEIEYLLFKNIDKYY